MRKLSIVFITSILFIIGCGQTEEEKQEVQERTEEAVQEGNDLIEQMAQEQQAAEDSTTAAEETDSLSNN
ncbi:MAG TPA: hypothetical protein EYM84_04675 [Flavobacteriales bacterium]|nr:hypothetical protein [Flavobacteriales bacterium]HIN39548.1 hypothetical protein [Flavobacteriales bacterium]